MFISIDKSKMAASNMADGSLKWIYLSYYSTQKGDVLHFMVMVFDVIDVMDSVKLPYVIYLTNPRWRYSK